MGFQLIRVIPPGSTKVGAFIISPQDILDEMKTVDTQVLLLGADIKGQQSNLPVAFLTAWDSFVKEWREFYSSHESWFSRVTSETPYEKVLEFRSRVGAFKRQFAGYGGVPTVQEPEPEEAWYVKAIKVGLVVTGIGLAGYGLAQATGMVRESRQLISDIRGKK